VTLTQIKAKNAPNNKYKQDDCFPFLRGAVRLEVLGEYDRLDEFISGCFPANLFLVGVQLAVSVIHNIKFSLDERLPTFFFQPLIGGK
jgi:hypothetical protein